MRRHCGAFVYLLLLSATAARAETVVRARLIAYRPAERVRQMASHVLNKEEFLFATLNAGQDQGRTIKVIYEHFGRSKTPDPTASEGAVYQLHLRRMKACDESVESYVKNSPRITSQPSATESPEPKSEGILFLNGADAMSILQHQRLPCYLLREEPAILAPER